MLVYKITNRLNGKIYIGQTINSLARRMTSHYAGNQKGYIGSAIKKYGRDLFSVETIATYSSIDDLNNAEQYFIEYFNCMAPNGYNLVGGGRNRSPSEETRKKFSESHKGYKHTAIAREKIGLIWRGKKQSMDHIKKRADARRGKGHTEQTRLQMSIARKGVPRYKPFTAEHCAKISAAKTGKPRPDMIGNKGTPGLAPPNKGKKRIILDGKIRYI